MMTETWITVLATAFVVGLASQFLMILIARKTGALDRPEGALKPHERPVPVLGGCGIFIGSLAGLIPAIFMYGWSGNLLVIPAAGLMLAATGLIDDLHALGPVVRIVTQLVAGLVLYFFGAPVLFGEELLGQNAVGMILSMGLVLMYVIGAVNSFNMMDGMDGLAGGAGLIAASMAAVILYVCGDQAGTALALCLCGSMAAFLVMNLPPAKIFMGDSGSYFTGGILAALMLRIIAVNHSMAALFCSMLIMGIFITDSMAAFCRRLYKRQPIFSGDRSHIYDLLLKKNISVPEVLLIMWVLSSFYGAAAYAVFLYEFY